MEKRDEKKPTIFTPLPLLQEQENAALVGTPEYAQVYPKVENEAAKPPLDAVQPKIIAYLKPAKIPPPPKKENKNFDSYPNPEVKNPLKNEGIVDSPSKNDVILKQSPESSTMILHEEIIGPPLKKDIQEVVKTEIKASWGRSFG